VLIETVASPALWIAFLAFVLAMLALDLFVFHRKSHQVSLREAAGWSAVWVVLALIFNAGVYVWFGAERAMEFTAGYLLEKALAVDNIFVFLIIFSAFSIPAAYQHRVLFWGVLGALVMRAGFILIGGAFLARFHWAIYVFGGILAVTGLKLLLQRDEKPDPEKNALVRLLRRFVPFHPKLEGDRFLVRRDGRWLATPLLLALVAVEASDLIFAVDSIPVIFAITTDPFLVFTSNIFAILGLRSMYFLLAGIVDKFVHLKTGLAAVLIFVGAKMLLLDVFHIPVLISLAVIASILGLSIAASLLRPPAQAVAARD
jgi:tellurite resistance protein TerC